MIEIMPVDEYMRKGVTDLITESWGAPIIVTKGKIHAADKLPGYVALEGDTMRGLATYHVENGDCEIVSLESLIKNQGIGTRLIDKVIEKAREQGCRRVWLITTNGSSLR